MLCHNSIPQIHLRYLSIAGVLYHVFVREHLALAVQHTLVFWNSNVYWMVKDNWCHNKISCFGRCFVFVSNYSEDILQENYNIIYGTYFIESSGHISDDLGIINQHKCNMHSGFQLGPLIPLGYVPLRTWRALLGARGWLSTDDISFPSHPTLMTQNRVQPVMFSLVSFLTFQSFLYPSSAICSISGWWLQLFIVERGAKHSYH